MTTYLCKICDKKFGSENSLAMHNKSKHADISRKPLFSSTQKRKIKRYALWIGIILLVSVFFYMRSIPPTNAPILMIDSSVHNFGTVSQARGIVNAELEIRNEGDAPLLIDNMETSCMCTSVSLVSNGVEGPTFGMTMHGTNPTNWQQEVLPGESVQLKIYYDPNAHKDLKGPVTRTITLHSNDPRSSQKTVTIKLNQVS